MQDTCVHELNVLRAPLLTRFFTVGAGAPSCGSRPSTRGGNICSHHSEKSVCGNQVELQKDTDPENMATNDGTDEDVFVSSRNGDCHSKSSADGKRSQLMRLFSRDAPNRKDNTFKNRPSESYESPTHTGTGANGKDPPSPEKADKSQKPFTRLFSRDAPLRMDNTFKERPSESYDLDPPLERTGVSQ
uniref:uncharacterized protein MBP isoform X1 n=2 Tax=Myxine glutinosa TaxID=7769 RepID=UPI00358F870F